MRQRADHIELGVLYDFVSGSAAMDAEARQHIDGCEQCRSDISWVQWMVDFGVQERKYGPPPWALANAENVFRLKKPGIVKIAKEIAANLIYDSFSEPLPIGVRRRDLPSRQALYQANNVQLDLKIALGDQQGLIIGQVVTDKSDVNVDGLQIEITQAGQVIGKSTTNAFGEFIFKDLPKGNYELQVLLAGTMVKLPQLPSNE